jgi:cytidylate kinase
VTGDRQLSDLPVIPKAFMASRTDLTFDYSPPKQSIPSHYLCLCTLVGLTNETYVSNVDFTILKRTSIEMLIGIIGNIRSGKTTVARILEQRYGFTHVSTNVALTQFLDSGRKFDLSREERFEAAERQRKASSPGYFIDRALNPIREKNVLHVVLTGLYTTAEAEALLRISDYGPTLLVWVDTPDSNVRWNRLMSSIRGPRDYFQRSAFDAFGVDNPNAPRIDEIVRSLEDRIDRLQNDQDRIHLAQQVDAVIQTRNPELQPVCSFEDLDFSDNHPRPLDDYDEVLRLERKHRVGEYLKSYFQTESQSEFSAVWERFPKHKVRELGNQFLSRLTTCFLLADRDESFQEYKNLDVYTVNEEMAHLLNRDEFKFCHERIHQRLEESKEEIHNDVIGNLKHFHEHDQTQTASQVTRSLQVLIANGITCDIAPYQEGLDDPWPLLERARAKATNGDVPILEYIKRDRILKIQGLMGRSKASLAIHDAVDHVWFTNLLSEPEEDGKSILERHSELMRSVGDPIHFDLFRRESEMIASIAFGVRYWASQQVGFVPRVSFDEILEVFERAIVANSFVDERHLNAYRTVLSLVARPRQREAQSLEFTFSNYVTELDEQRRKHGEIKLYGNPRTVPVGKLDPMGIDYISFFVDAHHKITRSKSFHRDTLLKVHVKLEDWLTNLEREDPRPLLLLNRDIMKFDVDSARISREKRAWMETNFGFTAYKEPLA